MDSLFEAKCPTAFSDGKLFESFEGNPEDYHFGDLVNDVEPFCGKKSIKTPRKLYPLNSDRNELLSLRRTMTDFYVSTPYQIMSPGFQEEFSLWLSGHYENMPIQIYWKFYHKKKWKLSYKKSDIFLISAQNINCWYSLELPHQGSSNEYPQSMLLSRNKKK